MSQTEMRMKGRAGAEGARASGDSSRDCWRTPRWLMDVLHVEFPMLWDASARSESEWAHGCTDGNEYADALAVGLRWPASRPVFANPPFSRMSEWAARIVAHPGQSVTVCKLAPSAKWWRDLTIPGTPPMRSHRVLSAYWGTEKGTIRSVEIGGGVHLWLLPCRVAYEPPPGIAASSPSFDSCVVVRS